MSEQNGAQFQSSSTPAPARRFGTFKKSPQHFQAIERVQGWTRERFALPEEAPVLVAELACTRPGCPPLETVVAFWTEAGDRHHFKIFKSVEEVVPDDIPPAWLKDALFAVEGEGFECC